MIVLVEYVNIHSLIIIISWYIYYQDKVLNNNIMKTNDLT